MGTERLNPINLSISAGLLGRGWPGAHPPAPGESFPSPSSPFPLIFRLTLHRSPGCHGDQWSHFSFLSASFSEARTLSLSLSLSSILYLCQSVLFSYPNSHLSSHMHTHCLLHALIVHSANFELLSTLSNFFKIHTPSSPSETCAVCPCEASFISAH